MAANLKSPKDKPPGSAAPRLAPRQTAASAARAARIATNRNLQNAPAPKPHQVSPRSPTLRIKSATIQRNEPKAVDQKAPLPAQKPADDEQNGLDDSPEEKHKEIGQLPNSEPEDTGPPASEEGDRATTPTTKEPVRSRPETPVKSSRPQTPRSRPLTPARYSRPRTPTTANSSRPDTPRTLSRPSTPAQPHRLGTPNEKVNKQENPNNSNLSPTRTASRDYVAENAADDDRSDLKQAFEVKHRQFISLKRDLDMKQQAVLSMFDNLKKLHDRMKEEGMQVGGDGFRPELVYFNVGDWSADEVAKLCQDAIAAQSPNAEEVFKSVSAPIETTAVVELSTQIVAIPNHFANLCLEAFTTRQQLIDWIKNICENNEFSSDDVSQHLSEYNKQGFEMCNSLKYLKNQADSIANKVAEISRRACRERDILFVVGESLLREVAKLRADTEELNYKFEKKIQAQPINTKELEETRTELDSERLEGAAAKEKIANLESQLKQAKARINKMDRQLKEADSSIASLTGTVKSLEDQSQKRELQLEARTRKLRENLKSGEMTTAQLAQQRDELVAEIQNLNERIENIKSKHKSEIQQYSQQIKDLRTLLEVQRAETAKEMNHKQELEQAYHEGQKQIEELKIKLEKEMRPKVDLPTEREMELHAELQATIETLRLTEEEVAAARKEKIRFLETMTKVTDSDNKVGMQQKFASELMNKEEMIAKLQSEIKDLKKSIKLNENRCEQYEANIREILSFNQAHGLVPDSQGGPSYQDLQQEIMDLRMKLLEAAHRNEELNNLLIQKEQELDQQDKTSRAQARVIKVREELINMLKHREAEQNQELSNMHQDLDHRVKIVEEVNRQIAAKSSEIQELFATLESKQQQIHRLEKIVLALEEQQRRAQAQRTRHEEKIAALEHELVSGGNRQNKKFLFF